MHGTYPVKVVFGPEGCGKTAWLKQAVEILHGEGYDAVYVDPLHKEYLTHTDLKEFMVKFAEASSEALGLLSLIRSLNMNERRWLEEAVEDLVTIVPHFTGKLYSMRSHNYSVEVLESFSSKNHQSIQLFKLP